MDVLAPTGVVHRPFRPLARRPSSLAGLRIGILDNAKPNADVLLRGVAERLAAQAGAASIRQWSKPAASRPAPDLEEIVSGADVVLTGSAD